MIASNRRLLETANSAIVGGDIEAFLAHCHDDIVWVSVGDEPIIGKAALREWMQIAYAQPPRFTVERMIEEGDWLVALGSIEVQERDGPTTHLYSDAWRCKDGKLAELRAFVIKPAG